MGSRRISNDVDRIGDAEPWVENVYAAAQAWVERGLLADDSIFTPGKAIWTPHWLGELRGRFLDRPDVGAGSFLARLEQQLDGSPPEVYQLMGEVLYVYHLILTMKPDTKKSNIERILIKSSVPEIPPSFSDGLRGTFINVNAGGKYTPFRIGTLVEFVGILKGLESEKRMKLLDAPWSFKDFLFTRHFTSKLLVNNQNSGQITKDLLLHIIFPDCFETISASPKNKIVNAFTYLLAEPEDDVDRRIQQIRPAIEARYGDSVNLYKPSIRRQWDPDFEGYTGVTICADEQPNADQDKDTETVIDFAGLAESLYLDPAFLQEINTLLHDKRQVIFQGPPGTGKTYVARALARHLAGGVEGRVTLVQFHPSYAYEDFVQGYRPALQDNGQAGFELKDGPLLRAAKQAAQDESGAPHFLVIDEINRGNLAKVFGELYFLLEYRDAKMQLQYGGESFALPENLYIIGTMNTADRSIALVDLALRRRFHFVEFHPDQPPIAALLRRYLRANAGGMEWVADAVDRANQLLQDDRNAALGPSYFMRPGLDDAAVARIWKHSVLPYIEERLFGVPTGRLDDFELDTLRRRVMSSAAGESADDTNESDGNPSNASDTSPADDA